MFPLSILLCGQILLTLLPKGKIWGIKWCSTYSKLMYSYYMYSSKRCRGAGAQACDGKRHKFWVQFLLKEIKYLIFPSLHSRCRGKARRWVSPLNKSPNFRSVLIGTKYFNTRLKDSLCLPCYVPEGTSKIEKIIVYILINIPFPWMEIKSISSRV